jgi:hypothetical protein
MEAAVGRFAEVASGVSTPLLLSVRHHFRHRNDGTPLRIFFPKGMIAKAHGEPNRLPRLPDAVCERVAALCETTLVARFETLPPLGRVYVDEALTDYLVPFSQRSASKALRTVVRGSRLPLPAACSTLRFFVWWQNGDDRTDIDLSASLFDADFSYKDVLSYYNLKGFGGVHSGDIVDAPHGASEFIDVNLARLRKGGVRYVVMTLHSYTGQPYCDLPECFAGWMARSKAGSGEIYEPKTVEDRLDLTANTRIAVPLVIDVVDLKVVWCDLALRNSRDLWNNVEANKGGITMALRSLVSVQRPNLYDLFILHARARGRRVSRPADADTVFAVADGTPFRLEEIAADYLR